MLTNLLKKIPANLVESAEYPKNQGVKNFSCLSFAKAAPMSRKGLDKAKQKFFEDYSVPYTPIKVQISIIIEKKRVRGVAVLRIVSKFARQVREKLAQKGLSKQL